MAVWTFPYLEYTVKVKQTITFRPDRLYLPKEQLLSWFFFLRLGNAHDQVSPLENENSNKNKQKQK